MDKRHPEKDKVMGKVRRCERVKEVQDDTGYDDGGWDGIWEKCPAGFDAMVSERLGMEVGNALDVASAHNRGFEG